MFAGGLLDQREGETVQAGAGLAEAQGFGSDLGVEVAAGAVGQERILAGDGGEAALGHAGDEDGVEAEGSGCAGGVADQDAWRARRGRRRDLLSAPRAAWSSRAEV